MCLCVACLLCVRVVSWAGFYGLNLNSFSLYFTHLCNSWYMYSLVYLICMFCLLVHVAQLLISQVSFVVIL